MFALPLSDPLWHKLDDAHRDRDIPALLGTLAQAWDGDQARSLFWDCLCHQDTCYGATYAAVPHLLAIAEAAPAPEAVGEIAQFLGYVSLVSREPGGCDGETTEGALQGLPATRAGWDAKLAPFRSLAQSARRDLADPDALPRIAGSDLAGVEERLSALLKVLPAAMAAEAEAYRPTLPTRESRARDLARYSEILARPPVDGADLDVIAHIRDGFHAAQAPIAVLCEQAYMAEKDPRAARSHLAGLCAAMGNRGLARLLYHGDEGGLHCAHCGASYVFAMFGGRMALYADVGAPGTRTAAFAGPMDLDVRDGAPSRAEGFATLFDGDPVDPALARGLALTQAKACHETAQRLRLLAGTFACPACGGTSPLA